MAAPRNLVDSVEALTFDCYGTLIDWDGGIAAGIAALPSLAGLDAERLMHDRVRAERDLQRGPYLPYGEVLRRSLAAAAAQQGAAPEASELERFAHGMHGWPPFADSGPALRRLARRFRLAILSNVESAVLRSSVALLDAPFALCVTAEDVRSYKPAAPHFEEGLQRLGLTREQVLHVACSPWHDLVPAHALGLRTLWVDRLGEAGTLAPHQAPHDAVVPDMASAAELLLAPPG